MSRHNNDYDVIILAYTDGLPGGDVEIENVSNTLNSLVLENPQDSELFSLARRVGSVNGLWITGHVNADGVYDGDKLVISISSLVGYLRILKPKWILINGCNSSDVLIELQNEVDTDIIVPYRRNLEDNYASQMASLLAIEYSRSGSIKKAVLKLSPTGKVYQYYRSPFADNLSNDELSAVSRRVQNLSSLLEGDIEYNRAGLLETVGTMEEMIHLLTKEVQDMKQYFSARFLMISVVLSVLSLLFIINLVVGVLLLWTL